MLDDEDGDNTKKIYITQEDGIAEKNLSFVLIVSAM